MENRFAEYLPCKALALYIEKFVVQETASSQAYKVFPGTAVVIGFQYRGSLSFLDEEREIALAPAGATGLLDGFRIFKNSPGIGTVLVFFREAGASQFLKVPLHELFNESLALDQLFPSPEIAIVKERLCEAENDRERIEVVEHFLLLKLQPAKPDKLVQGALALIHATAGNIRIQELTARLNSSKSPLEKRFRKAVGASPKKFASVVRMKQLVKSYKPGMSLTGLAYAAGFYDQAHFIREFKLYAGLPPGNFFLPGK